MAEEIEESLRAFLLTRSAVTALVGSGTSARIRPDRLHERDDPPAIIIEVDDEESLNSLDGLGGLVRANINIKCRATVSKAESRELAEAVRVNGTNPGTGLAGYSGTAGTHKIDAVLEDVQTSFISARDGSDEGYYDTDMSFVIMYDESI